MKKFLLIWIFTLSIVLNADYLLEYQMDNDIQKFMYHNASKSKLVTAEDDAAVIYKIGKKIYIVTGNGKNRTIIDMDEMRAMANAFGYDPSEYNQDKRFKPTIKKSSKRVSIAGIKGYEWIIRAKDDDGKIYENKVVVTNDKRVVKSVRAMKSLFAAMSGIKMDDNDFFEIEKGYVIIKADGILLHSFKEVHIDAKEYTLPTNAKRQKMPKIDEKDRIELEKNLKKVEQEIKKAEAEAKKRAKEEKTQENNREDIDAQQAMDLLKSFF